MAYRTTSTSSMSIPIVLGWKCSSCGKKNAVETGLTISRSVTTTSTRKAEQYQRENKEELEKTWANSALEIIIDPCNHPDAFRESVYTKECRCINCRKKEFWTSKPRFVALTGFCMIIAVISFIAGIRAAIVNYGDPSNLTSWVIFLVTGSIVAASLIADHIFKSKLSELPDDLKPQMVTFNEEVIDCAKEQGYDLLSEKKLDDTVYIIIGKPKKEESSSAQSESTTPVDSPVTNKSNTDIPVFCRKCGKKLKPGSSFCSYCGADLKV